MGISFKIFNWLRCYDQVDLLEVKFALFLRVENNMNGLSSLWKKAKGIWFDFKALIVIEKLEIQWYDIWGIADNQKSLGTLMSRLDLPKIYEIFRNVEKVIFVIFLVKYMFQNSALLFSTKLDCFY